MADTTALKNRIRAAIKANDNQEITGLVLQQALLDIIDTIADIELANGAVTSSKIATGAVTNTKLANDAVTTEKIEDDSISSSKIQDGAVVLGKIAENAIESQNITDGAITDSKIATGAVTNAKLANDAVSTECIEDSAVTTDKIADNAVSPNKLLRPLHDLIMAADPRPSGDPNKLTYNATTGYYEMNGLTDLTYAEMVKIYSHANLASTPFVGWSMFISGVTAGIRTNFPYASQGWGDMFDDLSLKGCCAGANDIEVLILISGDWGNPIYDANGNAIEGVSDRPVKIGSATWFFNGASALSDDFAIRRILTPIINGSPNTFLYAGAPPLLEDIFIITAYDVPKILSGSPNLSYESIRFLLNRATNTGAITVEVHPTVYAKLQNVNQWWDLTMLAQTKNISFTTVTNS